MRPALSDDAEWLARAQLLLDTASVTGSAAPPATDLDPALRAALRDLVEEAVFFTTRSTSVLIKLSHLHQKFDLTEFITSDFVNFFLHGRASKPKNTNHVRKRETAINTNIITNITTNTTTNTTANTRRGRITPVKEMVWYGVDEEGAVYSGNIVYDENSQGNDKAGSSKTPGQCGERIRALARQRK